MTKKAAKAPAKGPAIRTLRGKALYDLATALRGPDHIELSERATLKHEVTARLRVIALGGRRVCGAGDTNTTVLSYDNVDEVRAAATTFRDFSHTHALDHLALAVEAVPQHRLWGGHAKALAVALRGY